MRIAIDARKIGDFGIGTHVEGLLHGLASLNGASAYVVFVRREFQGRVPDAFERVIADVPNYSIREQFMISALIKRVGASVYHSPHFVLPLTNCPSIVTIHDVIPLHFPYRSPLARFYYRTMLHRGARRSARILTVTQSARDQIVAETGSPRSKIVVTPNGIDPTFHALHEPDPALGRYFLYVGNDKPHKNVDALVSAFENVRHRDTTCNLVLAGAPFARFHDRAGVLRTGFVTNERLASLYRGAIALVMPSLEEGFGLPAAEAMACGAPVITSEAPALVEVTGDAALHVDVRSPDALEKALSRVASDEALRSRLRAAGPIRARDFTWSRCAAMTRRVYESVAAESKL